MLSSVSDDVVLKKDLVNLPWVHSAATESLQPLISSTFASFLWLYYLKACLRILGIHLALMYRIILGISCSSTNERQELTDITPSLSIPYNSDRSCSKTSQQDWVQLLTLITFSLEHYWLVSPYFVNSLLLLVLSSITSQMKYLPSSAWMCFPGNPNQDKIFFHFYVTGSFSFRISLK